jgi:hypothetical protein
MRTYVQDTGTGEWTRISRDVAIDEIHAGREVLVGRDAIGEITPDSSNCVSVMEIAEDTYEITTPDGTTLDTVYHSADEALSEAEFFLMPLENRLKSFAEGLREASDNLAAGGDTFGASSLAKFAHDVERFHAHYKFEQVKRGERPADGPPTGQEPWLRTD